jgi:EmrB/QacA subfamily drug resistance transporter
MTGPTDAAHLQGRIIVISIVASATSFLDGSVVNVALPAIAHDLGGGVTTQQWVVDGYLLTLGSMILIAGSIADLVGRARALRVGLIIFGAASVGCFLAPTVGALVGARLAQGAGAALLVPSSLALLASTFSGEERGRAVGRWTAWTSVAFVAGPPLGGVLVDTVGWRWIFLANVPLVAFTLIDMRGIRDAARVTPQRLDLVGAGLVTSGLAALVLGLIEQPVAGWTSRLVLASLAMAVLLLTAFVLWERRGRNVLVPLDLFRSRNFTAGNLATVGVYAGVGIALLIVTLLLQEVAKVPALFAGVATLPVALTSLLLAERFGHLAGRHGARAFMTTGPLVAAVGFVWMSMTGLDSPSLWAHLGIGLPLYGLGLAMTVAPLTATVLDSVPPQSSGIASAVNNAIARVAGLLAVGFIGTVIGDVFDLDAFRRAAIATAAFFTVGGVTALLGVRNPPGRPRTRPAEAIQSNDTSVEPRPTPTLEESEQEPK